MSNKITGTIVNIPIRKPTSEEVERNQQQIVKLMDQIRDNPALMQRYAELTTSKFQELLNLVQRLGMDTVATFNQVWSEQEGNGECPFSNEQIGYAAMTTLNIVAVAFALGQMAQEAGEHTFTQAEVDKLWSDLEIAGDLGELPPRNERGN